MQFAPPLGWALLKKVGPARARAVSSGRSGYDVGALLRDSRRGGEAGGGGGGGGGEEEAAGGGGGGGGSAAPRAAAG
jgi:hypothetical protein